MAFDFKKEYKEFYLPKDKPSIAAVPPMNYVAVRGRGDPNEDSGQYKEAMNILYGVAYTIKMSKMGGHRIEGYFDYVVPPLEGLWWQEVGGKPVAGFDYGDKASLCWISIIRLPDFVTKADFDWAVAEAARRKGIDASKAEFITLEEGLCAQVMHHGTYDDEPTTIAILHDFIQAEGYSVDIDQVNRFHHEIYLGDPRKTAPEKLRTVIRYPVKK